MKPPNKNVRYPTPFVAPVVDWSLGVGGLLFAHVFADLFAYPFCRPVPPCAWLTPSLVRWVER